MESLALAAGLVVGSLRPVPFELYNDCRFRLRESPVPLTADRGRGIGGIERINRARVVKDSAWFVKMNAVKPPLRLPSGRPKEN
jgi:hypothetical protein